MDSTTLKGLNILEALVRGGGSRSVTELAQELGMVRSNVHRTLTTLCHAGFVEPIPDAPNRYRPTLRLWELGNIVVNQFDIRAHARPTMMELSALTRETVLLAVRQGNEVTFLERILTPQSVSTNVLLGARSPIYCNAPGKAILSIDPEGEVIKLPANLKTYTETTLATREALLKDLKETQARGYSINLAEWKTHVHSIGAAIRSPNGEALGAISISGPDVRMTVDVLHRFGEMLRDHVERLSKRLSG